MRQIISIFSPKVKGHLFSGVLQFAFRYRPCLLLLYLLAPSPCVAQTDDVSVETALWYVHLADSLFEQPERSLGYAEKALPVLAANGLFREIVDLRNGLNYSYREQKDTAGWEQNAKEAYELAQKHLLPTDEVRRVAANNFAVNLRAVRGDHQQARSLFEANYESLPPDTPPLLRGGLLYNIGNDYFSLGDFRTADKYYQVAAEQYAQGGSSLLIKLVTVATERCRIYTATRQYELAIKIASEALELLPTIELVSPEALRCQLHLAEALHKSGQPTAALSLLSKIEDGENASDQHRSLVKYHSAESLFDQGKYKICIPLLSAAVLAHLHPVQRSRALGLRSKVWSAIGQRDLALEDLNQGIREICPNGGNPDFIDCSADGSWSDLSGILRLRAQFLAQETNPKSLLAALRTYRHISGLNDLAREEYQSKDAQLLLLSESKSVYEEAMELVWKLQAGNDGDQYHSAALYFMEKCKSNLLRDEIQARIRFGKNETLRSLFDRQYNLRAILATQRRNGRPAADILKTERELEQVNDSLEFRSPYPAIQNVPEESSLEFVRQDLLGSDDVLISYLAGTEWTYRLRVGQNFSDLTRFSASLTKADSLSAFYRSLSLNSRQEQHNFNRKANQLQRLLVDFSSLPASSKRLLFIPDGTLYGLPFSALLTEEIKTGTPEYLLRKYRIHTLHSAFLPVSSFATKRAGTLGVYPLFTGQDREQIYVADQLGEFTSYRGRHYLGPDATKENFINSAADFDVLLMATHARANEGDKKEPVLSFIDGDLRLTELTAGRLGARLAILTACETGLGTEARGEGPLSMARSFSYAGVQSVVMSLWSIPEKEAVGQILALLKNLESDLCVDEALRNAQLAYLDDPGVPPEAKAPEAWAGLSLVGPSERIRMEKEHDNSKGLIVGLLLLFVLTWALRRYWKTHRN